jgi:CheY-like chemotaxis protein
VSSAILVQADFNRDRARLLRGGDSSSKVGGDFADRVDVGCSVVERMAEAKERVIMVVEDNPDHRKALRIVLESGGYVVIECRSGTEALEALEKTSVDLMTLDLSMPDVDGFEVLQAARSTHPELKIVVVSGFLKGNMNLVAKKLGAALTLDKSMASELLPIVRDLLNPMELTTY